MLYKQLPPFASDKKILDNNYLLNSLFE